MKDLKTQMRSAADHAVTVLAERGEIHSNIALDGVRLGPSQYAIDLRNVEPNLLIPRAEGDRILLEQDDAALAEIIRAHARFAGRVGR